MSSDRELAGQIAIAEDLDPVAATIGQTRSTQRGFIDARAIIKAIQRLEVHRQITRAVTCIVESALGDAANERHLTAFEADADRAARAGGLAFAAASAGFAVATGFALAQPFATVLGSGARFKIV